MGNRTKDSEAVLGISIFIWSSAAFIGPLLQRTETISTLTELIIYKSYPCLKEIQEVKTKTEPLLDGESTASQGSILSHPSENCRKVSV